VIGHGPGEDDRQVRSSGGDPGDDRGELVELAPLIGPGRIARADEQDVVGRVEKN